MLTCQVADAQDLSFPDQSVDLVFGSPPYCDARTYGIGAQRDCQPWIDWMLDVTTEALRVSRGPVVWVAAGVTRNWTYWPACEGLMYEWWKRGGSLFRPCYWHRVGIPGSGGEQWFRADVEYVMCFKREGKLPWADNTAMGHPPDAANYGTKRYAVLQNGVRTQQNVTLPDACNPGNLIQTIGGALSAISTDENEAPFPEKLAEWFVLSLCPENGTVLDPFSGSGTTAKVALSNNRNAIATDIRESQIALTRRRCSEIQGKLFV